MSRVAKAARDPQSGVSDEPTLSVTAAKWNAWLASHHASANGVVLKIAKKGGGLAVVSYVEAVEIALIWGWIDGHKRAFDDAAWLQRFTPRRAKSPWSKINRAKAEALIRDGKMQPSGLAEVERAKKDGRWEGAYDSASTSEVPDDLAAALAANAEAKAFFTRIDGANRYAILWRIQTAKKPETRAARVAKFVAMLATHETIHPMRTGPQRAPAGSKTASTRKR